MSPPPNTVLRRIDDKSEVKCLLNGVTSTLQCVGGQWDGEIGACERPSINVQSLGDSLLDSIDVYYNVTYNYIASLHPGICVFFSLRLFVWLYVVVQVVRWWRNCNRADSVSLTGISGKVVDMKNSPKD